MQYQRNGDCTGFTDFSPPKFLKSSFFTPKREEGRFAACLFNLLVLLRMFLQVKLLNTFSHVSGADIINVFIFLKAVL